MITISRVRVCVAAREILRCTKRLERKVCGRHRLVVSRFIKIRVVRLGSHLDDRKHTEIDIMGGIVNLLAAT